jgi:alpha-beta hydrolase superfamily lysophospholipase
VHDRITARLARFIVDGAREALERAGTLAVPTLLLVAGDDRLVPVAASRRFAQRAPRERIVERVYDGLWHELFNESEPARDRVFADLGAWLDARL